MNITCIYCLEKKSKQAFIKTEHIIPQSFGVFKNNFTLNDMVCDDCNKFFGDNLEIEFARDSMEGLMRYDHNIKNPSEFKTIGNRSRRVYRLPDGELKGAYAYPKYSEEAGRILLYPLPQIGFLKGTEREYFLLDKIPEKKYLLQNFNFQHPQAVFYLGCDPSVADKVLESKGVTLKEFTECNPPFKSEIEDIECEVQGTIDQILMRTVAKIGFNYLAYWQGKEFVLHKDFDVIRQFILTGKKTDYPLIRIDQNSILGDEPVKGKRRSGHIVTTNWAGDGVSIIAQVSLMNWVKYTICLARNFTGGQKDIKIGHFFNFPGQSIVPLTTDKEKAAINPFQN